MNRVAIDTSNIQLLLSTCKLCVVMTVQYLSLMVPRIQRLSCFPSEPSEAPPPHQSNKFKLFSQIHDFNLGNHKGLLGFY